MRRCSRGGAIVAVAGVAWLAAGVMSERFSPHRRLFGTRFRGEGWALYWELLLWAHAFPRSPEDRVGMLRWRMHRAARIFSLNFHLRRWTPQQAIDFLVEKVGHERFADTILAAGSMPIEMLRALLTNQPLTRDYRSQWRCYGDVTTAGR